MDRLGRNLDDLRKLLLGLTERGVQVQFGKESLIFTGEDSPMANLLLSVMGAFALSLNANCSGSVKRRDLKSTLCLHDGMVSDLRMGLWPTHRDENRTSRSGSDGAARMSWSDIAYLVVRLRWIRYSDSNQIPPAIDEITIDD
jgi:hypothetical protein